MSSSVPGLFAAGECTGGLFGANRVAAATTQMLVQGAAAGGSAAKYARDAGARNADPAALERACADALAPLYAAGGGSPRKVRAKVIEAVSQSAGMCAARRAWPRAFGCSMKPKKWRQRPSGAERAANREWLDALENAQPARLRPGDPAFFAGARRKPRRVRPQRLPGDGQRPLPV